MAHQTDTERQIEFDFLPATEITDLVTAGQPYLLHVAATRSLVMPA